MMPIFIWRRVITGVSFCMSLSVGFINVRIGFEIWETGKGHPLPIRVYFFGNRKVSFPFVQLFSREYIVPGAGKPDVAYISFVTAAVAQRDAADGMFEHILIITLSHCVGICGLGCRIRVYKQ